MMTKKITNVFLLAILFILAGCGGKGKGSDLENQIPFSGSWYNLSDGVSLSIGEGSGADGKVTELISLLDLRDSPAAIIMAEANRENPDRVTFEWNGKKGYAEYNRKDKSVNFFLSEGNPDESDLEYEFQPGDRFDRLTVIPGVDPTPIYDPENPEAMIDTLSSDSSIRLFTDSLGHYKVITKDGRLGKVKYADRVFPIHGTPSDKAFEYSYSVTKYGESTDSYGLEKHGDQVLVYFNVMPADGTRAMETHYVGKLDGPMIRVDKTIFDLVAAMDGDFSSAEPIDEPFTIFVVEPNPVNREPYILVDGKLYRALDYRNPIGRL